jgi:hypothetical protein
MKRATALRHAADCAFLLGQAERAAALAGRKAQSEEARAMAERVRDAAGQWRRYARRMEEAMTR